ncbi:MAG: hypothetical protein IPG99_20075 [Ignavibacteria bacterium]|nr:hypothetical protein [Ignavibacteria bacterium]
MLGDKVDLLKIVMMHGHVSADALKDGLVNRAVLQNLASAELYRTGSIGLFSV